MGSGDSRCNFHRGGDGADSWARRSLPVRSVSSPQSQDGGDCSRWASEDSGLFLDALLLTTRIVRVLQVLLLGRPDARARLPTWGLLLVAPAIAVEVSRAASAGRMVRREIPPGALEAGCVGGVCQRPSCSVATRAPLRSVRALMFHGARCALQLSRGGGSGLERPFRGPTALAAACEQASRLAPCRRRRLVGMAPRARPRGRRRAPHTGRPAGPAWHSSAVLLRPIRPARRGPPPPCCLGSRVCDGVWDADQHLRRHRCCGAPQEMRAGPRSRGHVGARLERRQ